MSQKSVRNVYPVNLSDGSMALSEGPPAGIGSGHAVIGYFYLLPTKS